MISSYIVRSNVSEGVAASAPSKGKLSSNTSICPTGGESVRFVGTSASSKCPSSFKSPAPKIEFPEPVQSDLGCPDLARKIFSFRFPEICVSIFILTVDGATKHFTVRRVDAPAPDPGKAYELWLMSDKLPQPRALGVLGGSLFTTGPFLAAYANDVIDTATYAVSLEQAGGSCDGAPHAPSMFKGKPIQTVPAAGQGQGQ